MPKELTLAERIQRNVRAQKLVDELIEDLVPSILDGCNEEKFWRYLAVAVAKKIGKRLADASEFSVMSDEEAARWEQNTIVPFGIFKGEKVCDVDPEYWGRITDHDFNRELSRYLRSERYRTSRGLYC